MFIEIVLGVGISSILGVCGYRIWKDSRSIEDRIHVVIDHAKREQINARYANLAYVAIAIQYYGWKDVAEVFFKRYIEEKMETMGV